MLVIAATAFRIFFDHRTHRTDSVLVSINHFIVFKQSLQKDFIEGHCCLFQHRFPRINCDHCNVSVALLVQNVCKLAGVTSADYDSLALNLVMHQLIQSGFV